MQGAQVFGSARYGVLQADNQKLKSHGLYRKPPQTVEVYAASVGNWDFFEE
jgi:hypothetical protein